MTSQPSLEQPEHTGAEEEEELEAEAESGEGGSLSLACMHTAVQVHQRLCLGFSRSLWYQTSTPANRSKDHISALVSSYQIMAPVITRFYHLLGTFLFSRSSSFICIIVEI